MVLLVEVNPKDVFIDESVFPNEQKQYYIYEHLKYYCSKLETLPTIVIRIVSDKAIVVRNHYYLHIAKELNHSYIRAIIDNNSLKDAVDKFLSNPFVSKLDLEFIRKQEQDILIAYNWYICYFERVLNLKEKTVFEEDVVHFFSKLQLPAFVKTVEERYKNLVYSHSGVCVEFQALTPLVDERWFSTFRSIMKNFHFQHVPILSFQGAKFLV